MKKIISLLMVLMMAVMVMAPSALAVDNTNTSTYSIRVNGEGIIKVVPDIGVINIGVQTEDLKSSLAQQKNAEVMGKIMETLRLQKIDKKDIKTISYNIYPKTKFDEKTKEYVADGYTVNNILEITIRDIDKIGTVLDEVAKQGANRVESISFSTSRADELYLEALTLAVKNGTKKAQIIAAASSLKITKPASINELSTGYTLARNNYYEGAPMVKANMDFQTPISQGEIEIKAVVDLEFK